MCDIPTKIRERGQFHLEEKKRCGSPHKIRVMYERKTRFIVNERALCGSHTKLSATVPLEN